LKKKKSGRKNRTYAIIGIVIIAVIALGIYFYNQQKAPQDNGTGGWVTSGPFSITKENYRLGDNVFMVVQGLKPSDAGNILVLDPKGGTYTKVPFNGTMKSEFNYFFKPNTQRTEKLCTPQDLIGNWTIAFQGTSYKPIHFQVINEWVAGDQADKDLQPIPPPC
jgi:hypothetical protein